MKLLFLLLILLFACNALAVHDKELENVFRDKLIVPPELLSESKNVGGNEVETVVPKPTAAEEDFLSMFDVG